MNWLDFQVANDIAKERIENGTRNAQRMQSGNWYTVRPRYLDLLSSISKLFTTRKAVEQQPVAASSKTQHRPA